MAKIFRTTHSGKRVKEALERQRRFPALKCIKEINSFENPDEVLIHIGDECHITVGEKGGYYRVHSDKRGFLFLTEMELGDYFDLSVLPDLGLSLRDVPRLVLGLDLNKAMDKPVDIETTENNE